MFSETDFLIIGGGVIGISISRQLKESFHGARVSLIEKEKDIGQHASGRNSGVLHAGFYYSPDSLKARFTKQGNRELQDYCVSKGIKVNRCGKLVVATREQDLSAMDVLLERGKKNRIDIRQIDTEEAKEIEPRVKTIDKALFSPTTASVDPLQVLNAMYWDAESAGVTIHRNTRYCGHKKNNITTTKGIIKAKYVVNAAGLYADKVARDFGCSARYRILPFKGLYLYSDEQPGAIRTNIYPVPNIKNPFLGVHFTVAVNGSIKIGPTAIPAFWRENYDGMDNFNLGEFFEIVYRQAGLFLNSNFDFKSLAIEEIRKYSRHRMVKLAQALAQDVRPEAYVRWGRPGIRAQLYDVLGNRLEMDFVLETTETSLHVLNAVSPAFTCSIPFARYVVDIIAKNT